MRGRIDPTARDLWASPLGGVVHNIIALDAERVLATPISPVLRIATICASSGKQQRQNAAVAAIKEIDVLSGKRIGEAAQQR